MSVARVVVFALALTHVIGVTDLVMGDACEERCSDDDCGDECPPGPACRCHCPSATPLLAGGVQSLADLPAPRAFAAPAVAPRRHATPDPREILHVPKRTA